MIQVIGIAVGVFTVALAIASVTGRARVSTCCTDAARARPVVAPRPTPPPPGDRTPTP